MNQNIGSVLFLVILTTFCTLFIAGGNMIYEEVKAGRQTALRMEMLTVFGEKFEQEGFADRFRQTVDVKEKGKSTFFVYKGTPKQAALLVNGPGLWSVIELLVFINEDEKKIKEVWIISQAETPGLGARIEEKWFLDQFRGLEYSDLVKIVSTHTGAKGEVDAISGATKTSKSVEAIINKGILEYGTR